MTSSDTVFPFIMLSMYWAAGCPDSPGGSPWIIENTPSSRVTRAASHVAVAFAGGGTSGVDAGRPWQLDNAAAAIIARATICMGVLHEGEIAIRSYRGRWNVTRVLKKEPAGKQSRPALLY